ncbi:MAG: hypothetical protein M1275_01655 [Patescibacteria group bacterium]|nr:hypothetical protein [Patescibacteria group bacterium]
MISNLFIFTVALVLVIKGATLATRYAARLAESWHLSKYTVGFIIVAVISILPETFIGINSAVAGIPAFGLGTLFGSNVADLTLVFAVIIFLAGRGMKVESKILKNRTIYPFLLLLPLILGWDGRFSRLEGLALIVAGGVFYYLAFKDGARDVAAPKARGSRFGNFLLLLYGMAVLLAGAHFTVVSANRLAGYVGINPVLIGMLVVGLGTTMPELFFSLQSVKKRDDSLAIGDLLGTVLADATVVVGILALIAPFAFPKTIIYISGSFMVCSAVILFRFMKTGRQLTKRESYMLIAFWLLFVLTEFVVSS